MVHDVHAQNIFSLFRGRPELNVSRCPESCSLCLEACSTSAIQTKPLDIHLGQCVFCGHCETLCVYKAIHFTNDLHLTCSKPEQLIIRSSKPAFRPVPATENIKKYLVIL